MAFFMFYSIRINLVPRKVRTFAPAKQKEDNLFNGKGFSFEI